MARRRLYPGTAFPDTLAPHPRYDHDVNVLTTLFQYDEKPPEASKARPRSVKRPKTADPLPLMRARIAPASSNSSFSLRIRGNFSVTTSSRSLWTTERRAAASSE